MLFNRLSTVKIVIAMMLFILLLLPQVTFAEQADGEYTIGFNIMHADKKNASIAEGYWDQPAKLIIKDGNIRVQTTINKHAWVTEFATRYNGSMNKVKTISIDEAADERLTEFQVANLTDLVESNVSVSIDHIDYNHSYTMYFKFKPETLTLIKAAEKPVPTTSEASPTASTTPTPIPTSTPTPTHSPGSASSTPAASVKPSSTAAATAQVSQSPSANPSPLPTPVEEESSNEETDSSSVHTSDAEQNEEVVLQSNTSTTAEVEETVATDSVEMIEKEKSGGIGNVILIVIVILVVLMALTAVIVYKTRQNKK